MRVYVTLGGIDHEGQAADSVQLFTTYQAAEEYGQELVALADFDYFVIEEREFSL